mgnify:FL=1
MANQKPGKDNFTRNIVIAVVVGVLLIMLVPTLLSKQTDTSAAIPASGTYAPASSLVPVSVIVNKASLTITASSASIAFSPRRYVVTAAYAGFVNGEDVGVLTTLPTCTVLIPGGVDISSVGRHTYATSCSGAVAPNYDISYVGGVLSVSNWS